MILNSTPVLATSVKALTRSLLFSLGVDHVLIDFLANVAIGAAAVLFAFLYVGARIPVRLKGTTRSAVKGRFTLRS